MWHRMSKLLQRITSMRMVLPEALTVAIVVIVQKWMLAIEIILKCLLILILTVPRVIAEIGLMSMRHLKFLHQLGETIYLWQELPAVTFRQVRRALLRNPPQIMSKE